MCIFNVVQTPYLTLFSFILPQAMNIAFGVPEKSPPSYPWQLCFRHYYCTAIRFNLFYGFVNTINLYIMCNRLLRVQPLHNSAINAGQLLIACFSYPVFVFPKLL